MGRAGRRSCEGGIRNLEELGVDFLDGLLNSEQNCGEGLSCLDGEVEYFPQKAYDQRKTSRHNLLLNL